MQVLVGCDPELFVKSFPDGKYISSHDLIPGTKAEPHQLSHGLGAIQVDGTAVEFNIKPAATLDDFIHNINTTMVSLDNYVQNSVLKRRGPRVGIAIDSTATFDPEYFKSLPEHAIELGCTPDFNAYTEKQNDPPQTSEPFRTASGHVHIGWTADVDVVTDAAHFHDCIQAVKQLDAVLYPVSLLWDTDRRRRTLYGQVGAFRPKSYGVEYRVLSNAWLRDERLMRWVYLAVRKAMNDLEAEAFLEKEEYVRYFRQLRDPSRTVLLSYYEFLVARGYPVLHKDYL